jgi:hypothetical protein
LHELLLGLGEYGWISFGGMVAKFIEPLKFF